MKVTIFLILCFTLTPTFSAPGEFLYVKDDIVNMRSEPTTKSHVVIKLKQGHRLVEIQKKGKWIEVGAENTGGKTGWLSFPLVSQTPVTISATNTTTYPPFNRFVNKYYNRLNKGLFTKVVYKGDGIINVFVNNKWLSVPKSDKTWSMNILLEAWSKSESGVVSINMVHPNGSFVMSNMKKLN